MMLKVPSQRLVLRLAPLTAAMFLGGCNWAVLNPKGPIGDGNATLLVDLVAIMLVIVVPTIIATLGIAWWFRSSNQRAFYLPDWEYSGQLELIVWAIPLLTIMLLGGVTWIGAHDLDPAKPLVSKEEPLNIQVVSLDWKWLFIYPDEHVASVNRVVIPGRDADPFFADLGQRHDRLLRPPAWQHDLHHEPDEDAALPQR